MSLEQQPKTPANLSFVFERHAIPRSEVNGYAQYYRDLMLETFVVGDVNLLVIETVSNLEHKDITPVYPRNFADFFERRFVDQVLISAKTHNSLTSKSAIARRVHKMLEEEDNHEDNYIQSLMKAADRMNNRGYRVGVIFEDCNIPEEEQFKDQFGSGFFADLEGYQQSVLGPFDSISSRDRKLIEQLVGIVENANGKNVNILIPRGSMHSGLIELLPEEYRNKIKFAVTNDMLFVSADYSLAILSKKYLKGEVLTDEDWEMAYEKHLLEEAEKKNNQV